MNSITLEARGKINLGLDVLGKRSDGYHLVKMVMQTVALSDTLTIEKKELPGIVLEINDASLTAGDDNLCVRAAKLLFDEFHLIGGVRIDLTKNIPIAAGMAGGSTDAAAVLKSINELYGLGLTTEELQERGLRLGADIPYCIVGGTALSEGIGEKLTSIAPMMEMPILIAKPYASASTKEVYQAVDALGEYEHPDIDGLVDAIAAQDLRQICDKMGNVLSLVTEPMVPEIRTIREIMMECGADGAMMTGSGPTVFGLFSSEERLAGAKEKLEKENLCQGVYGSRVS